jgi:hypothetical protein
MKTPLLLICRLSQSRILQTKTVYFTRSPPSLSGEADVAGVLCVVTLRPVGGGRLVYVSRHFTFLRVGASHAVAVCLVCPVLTVIAAIAHQLTVYTAAVDTLQLVGTAAHLGH